MRELLLIAGLVVGGFALRSFASIWLRRLGLAIILYATFRCGVAVAGSVWAGGVAVSLWVLVPVLQILWQTRHASLPMVRELRPRRAPSTNEFPDLAFWTEEFESEGFAEIEDIGWEDDENSIKIFSRVMLHAEMNLQGSINLQSQHGLVLASKTLVSRSEDGRQWVTSNSPFSSGLRLPPYVSLNRVPQADTLAELLDLHDGFCAGRTLPSQKISPDPDALVRLIQEETKRQIDHNLDSGLLRMAGDGRFAYSWRGSWFVVRQVMIDLVRHS